MNQAMLTAIAFPSPCGEVKLESSPTSNEDLLNQMFPSPCGEVKLESAMTLRSTPVKFVSIPLRGSEVGKSVRRSCTHIVFPSPCGEVKLERHKRAVVGENCSMVVSIPLRGSEVGKSSTSTC